MTERRVLIAIAVFSLVGLALASYSFLHNQFLASGEFCTINATFNCDVVNRGPFAKVYGVPVAVIGVLGYLFLATASGYLIDHPHDRGMRFFLLLAALGGLTFSLYLSGIEALVLKTWCVLCLTSQLIIITVTALSAKICRRSVM